MHNNRPRIFIVLAVAAVGAATASHLVSGRGKITIHADDRPIAEVLSKLSKQSGKNLFTTLPPETKVTLHADRAALPEVLETLAARVEGDWTAGYALAPSRTTAKALFDQWARRQREGLAQFRSRGFPLVSLNEFVFDPFKQQVVIEPVGLLHERLKNLAEGVEATFLAPESWNPQASARAISGRIGPAIKELSKSAGGVALEAVLLSGGWRGRGMERGGYETSDTNARRLQEGEGQRPSSMGWQGFGVFDNAEALNGMVKRAEQRIAQLPKEEQAAARAELEATRAGLAEIAALPPEERLSRIQERAQDPAFQQRMEERMAARDFRMTPTQRLQRYSRYIERKAQRSGQQPGR